MIGNAIAPTPPAGPNTRLTAAARIPGSTGRAARAGARSIALIRIASLRASA
jgi:hypothetical protein